MSRFDITGVLGNKEYQKEHQTNAIIRNPSMADYDPSKYHQKMKIKSKHLVPRDRREANNTVVKKDHPSPQSYDLLSGKGYVDLKNRKL